MRLKTLMLAMGVVLSGVVGALGVVPAYAEGVQVADVTCPTGSKRTGTAPTYADCNLPTEAEMPTKDVPTVAQTIINVIVSAVGIIAVAVIVIGGVLYVTSTGDAAKAKRAQNTILYGVVGLVVAVLAYAIVNFVLKSVF